MKNKSFYIKNLKITYFIRFFLIVLLHRNDFFADNTRRFLHKSLQQIATNVFLVRRDAAITCSIAALFSNYIINYAYQIPILYVRNEYSTRSKSSTSMN